MKELEDYLNHGQDEFDPLVCCFIAHYQLEAIHPFSDGNGRIGRVVLSLMIYQWCKLSMPWLYLSPFFERYKDEYIDNLFKVSAEGAWSQWIKFCLRGVIHQANKAVETCQTLQELRTSMHDRVKADGNSRIHAIIEDLFSSPLIRIVDLAKMHSVRYATAKSDVSYLVKKGILSELEVAKVKTFYSAEIVKAAYGEYS
jgi:Fic family protein